MDKSFYFTFYYGKTLHFAIATMTDENDKHIFNIFAEEEFLVIEFGSVSFRWNPDLEGGLELVESGDTSKAVYEKSLLIGLREYIKNHPSIFL
jgi:hypothetical protein